MVKSIMESIKVFNGNYLGCLVVVLVLGSPLLLFKIYENSGVCIEHGKILTDQELMELALQKPFQRAYKLSDDDSIRSYLKNHPNCCRVHQEKVFFNLYGLLPGSRWVSAGFKTTHINSVYFFHASVSSCGKLIPSKVVEIEETGSSDFYFN